jgi:hypothetical protein
LQSLQNISISKLPLPAFPAAPASDAMFSSFSVTVDVLTPFSVVLTARACHNSRQTIRRAFWDPLRGEETQHGNVCTKAESTAKAAGVQSCPV